MVIFLNLDGTAKKVTPERVFQGSNNVVSIDVVAPYPNSTALEIGFILPNGLVRTATDGAKYSPMSFVGEDQGMSVWTYSLPSSVTAKMGDAFVSLNAMTLSGNTTSYLCKFLIEESVLPEPSPSPEPDSWRQLILLYQQLAARLSTKTLLDFTIDDETGEGVKYYSDGTTAVVHFPTGESGGSSVVETDWLKIISFSPSSFTAEDDGSFSVAFGAEQTGFTDNKYMALLDRSDIKIYEAGATETVSREREGYSQAADSFFKGSDGSILIYGISTPFNGRLVLLGGSVFSGELVANVALVGNVLVVTFVNGVTTNIPLDSLVTKKDFLVLSSAVDTHEDTINGILENLKWKIIT